MTAEELATWKVHDWRLVNDVVRAWRNDERGTPLREFWPELADALDNLEGVWPS